MVLRPVRRRGMGLVSTALLAGGAYKAGSSAGKRSEQEAEQEEQSATRPVAGQPPATSSQPSQPSPVTDETLDQLRKLGELKKEGLLTYDEFETQKKRLLG